MDSEDSHLNYNEALIISELERRYYLYLIGGDYERMFYTLDTEGKEGDEGPGRMSRIRLEVEVTERERRAQVTHNCADPEYKQFLDYMLKHRINARLEQADDIITSCPEVADIKPLLTEFGRQKNLTVEQIDRVLNTDWLASQIERFAQKPQYREQLNLSDNDDLKTVLGKIGYSMFIWLMPRWCGEVIFSRMHPSLRAVMNRVRVYNRFISGAIATLAINENLPTSQKWVIYSLASINTLPVVLLLNIVNEEMLKLLEQQTEALKEEEHSELKQQVLQEFELAGDALRDVLTMDEIIKPHVIETLELKHFDPLPYILGYDTDPESPLVSIFFKARAYALYRQLFKTGRIHPHETAIYLKKYQINRQTLAKLNEADLTQLSTHITLHSKIRQSEARKA